jgi:hypothetical protein
MSVEQIQRTDEPLQNPIPSATYFYEPDLDAEDLKGKKSQFSTPQRVATPVAVSPVAPAVSDVPEAIPPQIPPGAVKEKKMHQSSTRIMKVTPDGRPFATVRSKSLSLLSFRTDELSRTI